ncbi:MAG TPA: dihydrolipoamide acetyltransferase family protein, partial [Polyangiales bacterium]|nr:dihydrolipoamide acetyltransferase family protein [Polyangiales bacterium]
MARLELKLPDIGEGVTQGEILEWFVEAGDVVREDDPMVEVMTDKATVTIGAPCDALVEQVHFEAGSVAKVGQVIVTLDSQAGSHEGAPERSSGPPASAVGDIQDRLPGAALFDYFESKPLATPATRRLAKDLGVDIRRVRPTGEGGRVTRDDVRAALRGEMAEDRPHVPLEDREPIVGIRRKIAERMHLAKTTAAHFTFVEECEASRLVDLKERLSEEAARRGLRLTYLPFIVKAVTDALRRHPVLNSAVDESAHEIVYKRYYDIGVATAT